MMPIHCQPKLGHAVVVLRGSLRIVGLTRVLILFCALLHHPGQAFSATLPAPYSLTLAWEPSPNPVVAGYHLYYGTASGNYTSSSYIAGNGTTATVSGLVSGVTYYFAITSVDAEGQESAFSSELNYSQGIAGVQMQIHGVAGGQFMLTVSGPAGHRYDIEATQDFSAWTVIGTGTLDAGGSRDFTDPDAADFPQRFYRTRDTQP